MRKALDYAVAGALPGAMVVRRPRMVSGVIDPYVAAQSLLTTKFEVSLRQGDSENTDSQIAEAITAYVAAGFEGATELGPTIDLAGYPNVTQPFTQAAWQINKSLSQLGTKTIQVQSDADSAKEMAYEMYSLYRAAIAAGRAASGYKGAPPAGHPSGFGGPNATGLTSPIPTIIVGGIAAGIAWAVLKRML